MMISKRDTLQVVKILLIMLAIVELNVLLMTGVNLAAKQGKNYYAKTLTLFGLFGALFTFIGVIGAFAESICFVLLYGLSIVVAILLFNTSPVSLFALMALIYQIAVVAVSLGYIILLRNENKVTESDDISVQQSNWYLPPVVPDTFRIHNHSSDGPSTSESTSRNEAAPETNERSIEDQIDSLLRETQLESISRNSWRRRSYPSGPPPPYPFHVSTEMPPSYYSCTQSRKF